MKCFIINEDEKYYKENIKKENNNINNCIENKRNSYKDMNSDINKNNQNIIKKIKTDYIKDVLIEKNANKINKINNFHNPRYHKSIKNTRNINAKNDFKNEKLNSNETLIY